MKAHKGSIATGIEITEVRVTENNQKEPETRAHQDSIATGIEITEERITGNKQKEPET